MTRERDYLDYLNDIKDAILKAQRFLDGIEYEAFVTNDEKTFAVVRALEIIGEAARQIPEPVRARYADIPWRDIVGTRDKLIHACFGVNLRRVWDTVQHDLAPLPAAVEKMIADTEADSSKPA